MASTHPEKRALLAATHNLDEMRQFIGADSLAFVSLDGLYRAVGFDGRDNEHPQFTDHYFTGDYPTPLTDQLEKTEYADVQLSLLADAG